MTDQAVAAAGHATRVVRPWLAGLARFGHLVRGIVYLSAAALAAQLSVTGEGEVTDPAGVLRIVGDQPLGQVLLPVLVLGLGAFGTVRLVEGLFDPEARGRGVRASLARFGDLTAGVGHLLLAWGVVRGMAHIQRLRDADQQARDMSREVLRVPGGELLLAALGIVIGIVGLYLCWRGVGRRPVCDALDLRALPPPSSRGVAAVIRAAFLAQGAMFVTVGALLVRAAQAHSAAVASGPAGAVRTLAAVPHGRIVIAVFAVALLAIAAGSFVDACWKRFPRDRAPDR